MTPSGSSCQIRRCSGLSPRIDIPIEVAVLVVSFPATARRMKNGPSSSGASRWPSTSAWTSAEVRSSVGFFRRSSASSFISPTSVAPAPSRASNGSRSPQELGVTGAQDDVGARRGPS